MLHCVLYISTARAGIARRDVDAIVEESQRNNAADTITGLLLFNGSNFMQLIEGDAEPIGALMRRLYADERHHALVKLADRALARRACEGWAMQPVAIGLDPAHRAEEVAQVLPTRVAADLRALILGFVQLN